MKLLKILGVLVILLIALIYTLAFTGVGNNLVKPHIEKIAKEKTGQDIKLSKFDLNFGNLDIVALINGEINANVKGNYSLFSQSFDVGYQFDVTDLKSFKLKLDEPMGLAGQVRGNIKDFSANGVGRVLDSDVRFLATMKEFKPFNVDLDAKGLNLSKALALIGQPAFISGNLDAVANIKNGVGTASINSQNAVINKEALKDKNITIPQNIELGLNSDITLENQVITASSNVNSKLLNIEANKTVYSLNSKDLESDFKLDIANLANLEPFTKQKLSGSLKADVFVKMEQNRLDFVNFNLDGFGGEVKTHLENSVLNADISGIEISQLLGVIAMPKAVFGVINGNARIDDIHNLSNIKGSTVLSVTNGKVEPSEFKKLTNLDFPKNNSFTINSDTSIENGMIHSNSNLISNLLKVENVNANYDLKAKNLKANFIATIEDLSKLKEFTKKTLQGNLKADGKVEMINNALSNLNLNIQTLGGRVTADSSGKNLNAKVTNLHLDDIFSLIGQNALASGLINSDIALSTIDPKNLNGVIKFNLANSTLNEKELSKILKKEFPSGVKLAANGDISIVNSTLNFITKIDSDLANITKFDGSYNLNTSVFDANYEAMISDLSKLAFTTGRKMNGSLKANGDIKKDKSTLLANLYSDLYSGKLKANITNENIVATFDKFQILELTRMLNFGEFYTGVGDLVFKYNTAAKKGDFNVDINQGRLTSSELTTIVSLLTQRDITQEVFNNSWVKGAIDGELINFNAHMKAPKAELNATSASLNTKSSKINIPVSMNVEKTDLAGEITGTTSNPKVNIKSNYLEKKLDEAIGKGLDKLLGNKKDANNTKPTTIDDAIGKGLDKLLNNKDKNSTNPTTIDDAINQGLDKLLGNKKPAQVPPTTDPAIKELEATKPTPKTLDNDINATTPSKEDAIKDEVKNLLKGFF